MFRDNIAAVTGFSLTYLVAAALFLPVGALLETTDIGIVALSTTQWYLVIGYVGAAWSFSIYLEQMFVADLFLWHREWEPAVAAAEREGHNRPSMRDVSRPTLLGGVASLEERKLPGGGTARVETPGSAPGSPSSRRRGGGGCRGGIAPHRGLVSLPRSDRQNMARSRLNCGCEEESIRVAPGGYQDDASCSSK